MPVMPEDGEPPSDQAPRRAVWRRLGLFALLSALFIGLGLFTPLREWFRVEQIQELSRSLGYWGPAAILLLGVVSPLFFAPRWPIAFVCGLLYGVVWGSLLANVASTLGAWLHFLLSRTLLAPGSSRLLRKYRLEGVRVPGNRLFFTLFFLRAFPLSNFVATNILAGSLHVHLRTYLLATFLGMVPSTLMYASWGKLVKRPSGSFYLLAALTLAFLCIGTAVAQRRFLPWLKGLRAEDRDGPAAGDAPPPGGA